MSVLAATWVGVALTALLLGGTLLAVTWRGGRRDGKLDAILDELRRIGVVIETGTIVRLYFEANGELQYNGYEPGGTAPVAGNIIDIPDFCAVLN